MRKYILEFLHRGMMAAWGGPAVLAIVYGILGITGAMETLTPAEVCRGILTVTAMAFIAAGITVVYTIDRLPLAAAVLIHGAALYLDYLILYLVNNWLPRNSFSIGIFSAIFVGGDAIVWVCINLSIRSKTNKINRKIRSEKL